MQIRMIKGGVVDNYASIVDSLIDPAFMPQPSGNMASAGVVMGPVDDAAF